MDTLVKLYKKALEKYLADPMVGIDTLRKQKKPIMKLIRQQSSSVNMAKQRSASILKMKSMKSGLTKPSSGSSAPRRREEIMMDHLRARVDRKKRDIENGGRGENSSSSSLSKKYEDAFSEVKEIVLLDLEEISVVSDMSVDGLMLVNC